MLVSELDKNRFKKIDSRFYDSLPKFCDVDSCGFPMEINEVLTKLTCSNVRCPKKIAKRVQELCQKLGIEITYLTAFDYVTMNHITNPMYLFKSQAGIELEHEERDKIIKQMSLERFVDLNCLPFIEDTVKIFREYDSLEDFYDDLESEGIEFLEKQLSVFVDEELSIRALKAYDVLMTFKQDLFDALDYVEIGE